MSPNGCRLLPSTSLTSGFSVFYRREEARRAAPPPEAPRIRHRPSEQDVNAARKIEVPKGRGLPDRPAASSSSGKARECMARSKAALSCCHSD